MEVVKKMKNKKKIYSIFLATLGTVAVTTVPALTITSCGSSDGASSSTPSKQPAMVPTIQPQTEDEKLATQQTVTRPADMPSTDFTNYLYDETTSITDVAQVAYTSSVIKEQVNEKFNTQLGAQLVNVTMIPDGNYTPVRYFVQLEFDQQPNEIEGFKPSVSKAPYTLISTTYYPTRVLSENVLNHQFQGYSQQDLFYRKEVKTHDRTPCKSFYETELNKKYKNDGFLYPGYDCDYTKSAKDGNTHVPDGYLTVGGTKIDMIPEVLAETPQEFNDKGEPLYKGGYADAAFIKKEIDSGNFKKHPAVENFYNRDVQDTTKAIDTEFIMSTAPIGPQTLGLYAPAGEVMQIQFSSEELQALQASNTTIQIIINDNFWDGMQRMDGDGLQTGRVSNRYPRIQSRFTLNNDTWKEMINKNSNTYSFGTPFGGNISINFISPILKNNNYLSFGDVIKFQINNAVKSLSYFDGFTTEDDWKKQIEDVLNGTITSPSISILSSLYSANIPFTDPKNNQCATLNAKNFIYPKDCAKEWNDFLLLSNNFGGRYQGTGRLEMLDMRFCNGVWNGASAMGGGMMFSCPIDWGANSFLNGSGSVNFDNWGAIHEVNHNFQVNSAWFKLQTHPETNIVNLYDLSIISNDGRYRSELNLNDKSLEPDWYGNPDWGGWNKLSSPFNVVRALRDRISIHPSTINEWAWYAAMVYTVGSYNFGEFTRYNQRVFPNGSADWTPIKFIAFLSEYFKTNMWNLCRIAPMWNDANGNRPWPSEDQLKPEEKKILKGLQKYPAIDYVANQYACGQYMYNYETKEYDYTSDITTPYEIPALQPYNFNFENYIVCDNIDFAWDKLEFTPTTKCGGKVEVDPSNHKRLIYTPNPDAVDQIDEFNVKIIPTADALKKLPANYVPGYCWKIKVRQVINRPVVQSYLPLQWRDMEPNFCGFFDYLFDAMGLGKDGENALVPDDVKPYSLNTVHDMDGNKPIMALTLGKTSFCKYEFNYVVPKTGTYYMWTKSEDAQRTLVDGKQVYQYENQEAWNPNNDHDYRVCPTPFEWKAGDVHKIELGVVQRIPPKWEFEKGYIDIQFSNQGTTTTKDGKSDSEFGPKPGGELYPIKDQVLVPCKS